MTSEEIADVLVIGSGPSAGAFPWSVSQEPGLKAMCLEQGDSIKNPQFCLITDTDQRIPQAH